MLLVGAIAASSSAAAVNPITGNSSTGRHKGHKEHVFSRQQHERPFLDDGRLTPNAVLVHSQHVDPPTRTRRVLKNCATHHCSGKKDWDYDYVPDEGEEGDLPIGDEVQGWRPVYGVPILFGIIATIVWAFSQVCKAASVSDVQALEEELSSRSWDYRRM